MHYRNTDTINSVLSRQEVQRLKIESEKRTIQREYDSYRLLRSILIFMLLRDSINTFGIKYSHLLYKEIKGYKAPLPILRPHSLIISSTSKARIKKRIIYKQTSEIIDIYDNRENHIKRILNNLYGRKNIYDC